MRGLLTRYNGIGAVVVAAALVAACGGGGGGGGNPPPTTAPTNTSSPPASQSTGSVTSSTTSSVALPSLSVSGIGVTGTLPSASVATAVTESLSVSAPSGAAALLTTRAATLHRFDTAPDAIVYVEFSAPANTTLSAGPTLTFTLPSVISGDSYYLAYETGSGWQEPYDGPGTISGSTVSFASTSGSIAITPASPALFVLYAIASSASSSPSSPPSTSPSSSPSPSPTQSPTVAPTQTATPEPIVASTTSVSLSLGGSSQIFEVSELGYSGSFTASASSCTSGQIATLQQPTTQTPVNAGAAVEFTVAPSTNAGTCTVTVTDQNSQQLQVTVYDSSTGVTVEDKPRK